MSAVAGCVASNDEPTSPTTTTTGETTTSNGTTVDSETATSINKTLSRGETATSAKGVSVTVSDPRVRKIIYTPDVGSIAHSYPAGRPQSQFLVFSISVQNVNLITSPPLSLFLDGKVQESQIYRHSHSPGRSGLLSFQVPITQVQSGAVVWRPSSTEQYRWTLPNPVVKNIGSSPRFEVKKFAVPDTITRGNPFTASLTVTNTGDRDGRFLAVVLTEGPSSVPLVDEFHVSVPVGKTVTHDLSGRPVEVERSSMTAILDWGINEQLASFSITE